MSIWQNNFIILGKKYLQDVVRDDRQLYEYQCNKLTSFLLLKDTDEDILVKEYHVIATSNLDWINKGELIAGSFITSSVRKDLTGGGETGYGDIDIYFKSIDDAKSFLKINEFEDHIIRDLNTESINDSVLYKSNKINLIWGVKYDNAKDLISKFDIRACSVAYNPNSETLHAVDGSFSDIRMMKIVFNPVPRATSIQRLVKYINKGYSIDKYQRLFFAQLIKSDIYSPELELTTGY